MVIGRVMLFLSLALALVGGVHYFLWGHLVRDPQWSPRVRRAGTVTFVALALSIFVALAFGRKLPWALHVPVAWVAFVWVGFAGFLFLSVLLGDLVLLGAKLSGRLNPARRVFFARSIAGAAGVVGAVTSAVALREGLRAFAVKRVSVTLPKLPAAAHGLRVVQVTDVHVGPMIGRAFVDELVARINALSPDVVAITGDLVDGSVEELGPLLQGLANLRATHGVFFVTGNHEYYSGAEEWVAHLPTLGVRVLRNERVTIEHNGVAIDLAGVNDWGARRYGPTFAPDLPRALRGRDTTRPLILLAHQPRQAAEAAASDVCLVLSGHTHGGQLWPWSYFATLDQPYIHGLHTLGATKLYVSEGTGYWGPPMRLGTRAEITDLVLS